MRSALVVAAFCLARPAWADDASAEARSFFYADDDGLQVLTVAGRAAVPVGARGALSVEAMVDAVDKQPIDATSGASITTAELRKQRYELAAGYGADVGSTSVPLRVHGLARASHEPDYLSFSGELGAELALAERNATLSGFLGYGRDRIDPTSYAPADEGAWPASHQRVLAGASLSQILGPRLEVSLGSAVCWQWGMLSSPYRRAILLRGTGVLQHPVRDAERHPGTRGRATAYLGAAWYLGRGAALHARLGGYADTWGVRAVIPEAMLAVELGPRGLLSVRYRFYLQRRASFYQPSYTGTPEHQTGDRRLGVLTLHAASLAVTWQLGDSLELLGSYQLSLLDYRDSGQFVTAHIASLGIDL